VGHAGPLGGAYAAGDTAMVRLSRGQEDACGLKRMGYASRYLSFRYCREEGLQVLPVSLGHPGSPDLHHAPVKPWQALPATLGCPAVSGCW